MLQAIGHILPIALAVAISSVPIMATILILLSPKRREVGGPVPDRVGPGHRDGGLSSARSARSSCRRTRSPRQPEVAVAIGEIVVGAALVVIAVFEWRRARRNPTTTMPKWLHAVGSFGRWPAFGTAFALNVRPKGLLLAIAAGLAIRGDDLSFGESAVAIGIYTIVGASTVAVPIIVTLADPKRMQPRLVERTGMAHPQQRCRDRGHPADDRRRGHRHRPDAPLIVGAAAQAATRSPLRRASAGARPRATRRRRRGTSSTCAGSRCRLRVARPPGTRRCRRGRRGG